MKRHCVDAPCVFLYIFKHMGCRCMCSSVCMFLSAHTYRTRANTISAFCISLIFLQFVFLTFWGIFAIDRELVYPANMDLYIPVALNHYWVRTPLSTLIVVTQIRISAASVYHSLSFKICFCTPIISCRCIQEVL